MLSVGIVPSLDEDGKRAMRFAMRVKIRISEEFVFERREETFCHRVIPAIAVATHALDDTMRV